MTEDGGARVSSSESTSKNGASQTRQRKKRKWDQPAESIVSVGFALPGVLPIGNMGSVSAVPLPTAAPVSGVFLPNPFAGSGTTIAPLLQAPTVNQPSGSVVPKVNQPKIQEELIIAREIVINDAEPSVRYKLTKRQTQEEIQRCTGAVVITRGKYRPPNALPDGEKPLYLHISGGTHLKETAERILAVDHAAAMVEEMLKQGPNGMKGNPAFSTCVYLGFDADPSLNLATRIRGPNDQYINHIMNETGATVVLRGHGSGNSENPHSEELQQPLHLVLSSSNPKSLEDARLLAENLLDTIRVEFDVSRVSSCKVYGAVPPPQKLLTGVQSFENEPKVNESSASALASSAMGVIPPRPISSITLPGPTTIIPQRPILNSGGILSSGQLQLNVSYPQPLLAGGTSYSGYGGIYPQATPLQQVALALKQSPSAVTCTVAPTTVITSAVSKAITSSTSLKEKQPPQKRKFQELPAGSRGSAKIDQASELIKPSEPSTDVGVRNLSSLPAPKKLLNPTSNGMSPLPRSMPPPPPRDISPPPKFITSTPAVKPHDTNKVLTRTKTDAVPDTLVKLMEYGEEDDDPEDSEESFSSRNSSVIAGKKPFWAV